MDNANTSVFHSMTNASKSSLSWTVLIILFVAIALGVWGGYFLAQGGVTAISQPTAKTLQAGATPQVGVAYGTNDTSTFKDTAEGTMTKGGIDGEGQFHLVRPGGDSQNVYLTSSLVDLSLFVGKKVKVWGQTQKAQSAGWLMDVGKVEVTN